MPYIPRIAELRQQREAQERAIAAQRENMLLQGLVVTPALQATGALIPYLREKYLPTDMEAARTQLTRAQATDAMETLEARRKALWEYENAPIPMTPEGQQLAMEDGRMVVAGMQPMAQQAPPVGAPGQMRPPAPRPTLEAGAGIALRRGTNPPPAQPIPPRDGGLRTLERNPWQPQLGAMPDVSLPEKPIVPRLRDYSARSGAVVSKAGSAQRIGPMMSINRTAEEAASGKNFIPPVTQKQMDAALAAQKNVGLLQAGNTAALQAYNDDVTKYNDTMTKVTSEAADRYMKAVSELEATKRSGTQAGADYRRVNLDVANVVLEKGAEMTAQVTGGETDPNKWTAEQTARVKAIVDLTSGHVKRFVPGLEGVVTADALAQAGSKKRAELVGKWRDANEPYPEPANRGAGVTGSIEGAKSGVDAAFNLIGAATTKGRLGAAGAKTLDFLVAPVAAELAIGYKDAEAAGDENAMRKIKAHMAAFKATIDYAKANPNADLSQQGNLMEQILAYGMRGSFE